MSDKEYVNSFTHFFDLRKKVAKTLIPYRKKYPTEILDILAGHGFYSKEVAKNVKKSHITAIGLQNDLESYDRFVHSFKNRKQQKCFKKISYKVMNVADLEFSDNKFDMVVNFLGLEDVNMTIGIGGVKMALKESVRVLKPNSIIQITLCQEGNDPDQKLAKEITEIIGHQAIFHEKEFYIKELKRNDVEIIDQKRFYTKRKMTAEQAKEELLFACNESPNIFREYNVKTIPFEMLWQNYKEKLEKNGMAYYSELLTIIGRRRDN